MNAVTPALRRANGFVPEGQRQARSAWVSRRGRIISADLIEDQKTRLFHSCLGATLLRNLNIKWPRKQHRI
jgi:hypothetical protein